MNDGDRRLGEQSPQVVEDIAVCPAGIQKLHAGFRPQVTHAVFTHQQRPEPMLVQHCGQCRGGFFVLIELAVALQ